MTSRKEDFRQKDREKAQKEQYDSLNISEIIIGEVNDDSERSNVVVSNARAIREHSDNWQNKAVVSLDGLFRPVAKVAGSSNLPQYVMAETGDYTNLSHPNEAQPPIGFGCGRQYNFSINNAYLDPLVHPDFEHHGSHDGHDWDVVGRHSELLEADDFHISMVLEDHAGHDTYTDDSRIMALRGPLVLQSWGYDTDGKPVPNKADFEDDTREGTFVGTELEDTFLPGWLKKYSTHPIAPVDFRFDRKRGVWVCPPSCKLVQITSIQDVAVDGVGQGYINDGRTIWDTGGEEIPFTEDNHISFIAKAANIFSGEEGICYYNVEDDIYWLISITENLETEDTGENECGGYCIFEWSEISKRWTQVFSNCSDDDATTTTTDPTSTSTLCPIDGTTVEPEYNPTGECYCAKPIFCGSFEGQCTKTTCLKYETFDVFCPGDTGTTTCDCNTTTSTTTEAPTGECTGCVYKQLLIDGMLEWILIENNCGGICNGCKPPGGDSTTFDPGHTTIHFDSPADTGTFCDELHVECDLDGPGGPGDTGNPPPPVPPGGEPCGGGCRFIWYEHENDWFFLNGNCRGGGGGPVPTNCVCGEPSYPGTSDCEIAGTPCFSLTTFPTSTTPTTGGPGSTTESPRNCIIYCNTSSTTTEAPSCNDGWCTFKWGGEDWELITGSCPEECPCAHPTQDADEDCSTVITICGNTTTTTTTTTTTSTSSTTSSTTTSTTTLNPCQGLCRFECMAVIDPPFFAWIENPTDQCGFSPTCTCFPEPTGECNEENEGEAVFATCGGEDTGTTTTTTTTSTTIEPA